MAKYDPLFEHLRRAGEGPIEMTFDEVERLVGPLPASASRHQAWWGNEAEGGLVSHVQARAWLDARREVRSVDQAARRVRFSAAGSRRGTS